MLYSLRCRVSRLYARLLGRETVVDRIARYTAS